MKKLVGALLCVLAVVALGSCRIPNSVPKAYLGTWEGWYLISDYLRYTPTVLYSHTLYGDGTITLTLYDDWSFDGVLKEKDFPEEEITGKVDRKNQTCDVEGYWAEPPFSTVVNQIDGTLDMLYHNAGYTDIKALGRVGDTYIDGAMGGTYQDLFMYLKVTKK
jgi:hypothetical protein